MQLVAPAKIELHDCISGGDNCNAGSLKPEDDCSNHGTSSAAILIGSDKPPFRFRGVTEMTLDSFKIYPSIFNDNCGCTAGLDARAAVRGFHAAVRALDKVIVAEIAGSGGERGCISLAANAAFDAGAAVIAANGNEGAKGWRSVTEPASAARVLGVGNYRVGDGGILTQSLGPTADNRIKPDLQAPTDTETASNGCCMQLDCRAPRGSNVALKRFSETSGATPYAAGAAALLRSFVGRVTGRWNVDPGLVYALMILSGRRTDFDNEHGVGLIRLPTDGTLRWGAAFVRQGQTLKIPIDFDPAQGHLDAAIWWPEDGEQCRHNDIDLMIVDPTGVVKNSSISIPSVFERVRFQGTMQDRWSVQIHGYSVERYSRQQVYFAIYNRPTPPP
jgi:subtilisin family serine protease